MKTNELKCTDLRTGNLIKAKGALSLIIGKVIEINMVHVVIENKLVKHYALTQNYILAFPTAEMRDAFNETDTFKYLINKCKKLL